MDTLRLLFFFSFFAYTASCLHICSPSSCSGTGRPVLFPFRLIDRQAADRCGYPRFDLSCSNQSQTLLNLPSSSGEFIVKRIDYDSQSIFINDPDFCLPKRILSLSLSGSPFRAAYPINFTFFNCTSPDWHDYRFYQAVPLTCLSSDNYTVFVMASGELPAPSCRNISTVSVPVQGQYQYQFESSMDFSQDLQLTWDEPNCRACLAKGGTCGFKSDSGSKIGCSNLPRHGLPRSAKYGIIVGAGIPGLVCMIGIACYICSWIKAYGHRRRQLNTELTTTSAITPQPAISITGLDASTIESYPKTVLGENQQLPKSSDGTCSICLSEYQPKETLRTIPKCNHCFHATCIDEWLQRNATCPLCRNSRSSVVTPCSSTSSSSFSTS